MQYSFNNNVQLYTCISILYQSGMDGVEESLQGVAEETNESTEGDNEGAIKHCKVK